jgi:hypothetical protein
MISYRLTNRTEADWHLTVAQFISALADDPELKTKSPIAA